MMADNVQTWAAAGGPQDVFYARDSAWPYPLIVDGDGVRLVDKDGRRYLDISSGPVASNLGHRNARVVEAIRSQVGRLSFAYSRVARTQENIAFSADLCAMTGPGLERCFLASGGSEAMDMALKFARVAVVARGETNRTRIFSLMPSYHGGTLATLAISGDQTLDSLFAGMAVFAERVPAPLSYRPLPGLSTSDNEQRILQLLEQGILAGNPQKALALVVEPVGGTATGANVLSAHFLGEAVAICRRHGLFVIFDEVMSGAGRTGSFLAAGDANARPDVLVLAKGLSAGYQPLGAMLASQELVDSLAETRGFNFAHTANANPLACTVGSAVLAELRERDLIAHARALGQYIREQLEDVQRRVPVIGDVRGRGLLMAIEVVQDRARKQPFPPEVNALAAIRYVGLQHGLMIYARRINNGRFGDWFMVSPPLVTTFAEADEMIHCLELTLRDFGDEMVRRGYAIAA